MANLPALTPTNFTEALQFAEALAKSTMVPPAFQRAPANILVAIQWGAELGLGPLQALQNIAVINGRPAVYGDAMLALVRGSPLCEDVVERMEGTGDSQAAVCVVQRKGKTPVIGRFDVDDAKRAGLWGKSGPWSQYPRRMLQMRARGFALRDAFPDVLRGVISAEEAGDIPRDDMKDVTPHAIVAAELDAFAAVSEQTEPETETDPDTLLATARTQALLGYAAFRGWYGDELDDDQREALKLHIETLQETARTRDKSRDIPVLNPRRLHPGSRSKSGWDWMTYASELIDVARTLEPPQISQFRVANRSMMDVLHDSDKENWSRVQQALSKYEHDDKKEEEEG